MNNSTTYLSYCGQTYQTKNKLEAAVLAHCILQNRRLLVGAKQIEKFKKFILDEIESLNKFYPRCKPVKATWDNKLSDKGDYTLSFNGLSICCFYLYKAKEVQA